MMQRQKGLRRGPCARAPLGDRSIRCALLWSALLLLSGCVPSRATTSATPSATATLTPTPALGALPPTPTPQALPGPATTPLDPAPTNCPSSAPLQRLAFSQYGGFIGPVTFFGSSPVWMDFMPQTVPVDGGPDDLWPGTKIIWEVGPNYRGPAIIEVTNLTTGHLAWWGQGGPIAQSYYGAAQALLLDPHTTGPAAYHGSPEPGWNERGSFVYLLQASCYAIDATWAGGHWRAIFPAGRQ